MSPFVGPGQRVGAEHAAATIADKCHVGFAYFRKERIFVDSAKTVRRYLNLAFE